MNTLEFLNRISFFSILSWCFFFIAATTAIIITSFHQAVIRKYRATLISVSLSCLTLGLIAGITPFLMRRLNPDQSRLTPLDQLAITDWSEPLENPETEFPTELGDQNHWLKNIPFQFRFKLRFRDYEFSNPVVTENNQLVILDESGNLHGFNPYTGLNHWSIRTEVQKLIHFVQVQKKLYLLDRHSTPEALRITCIDLQNPSMLWQRTIPHSKEGDISFDNDAQALIVTTGTSGIWSLYEKTGEILWKRPEIYSKVETLSSSKHVLVFEPGVGKRVGAWYFLDSMTGKTLKRSEHVYPEIQAFTPVISNHQPSPFFLAQVNPSHFFYMNHIDLNQIWSDSFSEPVESTLVIDANRYLVLHDSKLLELRELKTNTVIWQKQMTDVKSGWIKISPNLKYLTVMNEPTPSIQGIGFYNLETGDYLFTATTSEPILDIHFFGDWFYLFSEHHLWGFQKNE